MICFKKLINLYEIMLNKIKGCSQFNLNKFSFFQEYIFNVCVVLNIVEVMGHDFFYFIKE